jgi:hypothetical protein
MNGSKAKRIRREVYGDLSPRGRAYDINLAGVRAIGAKRLPSYTVTADELRRRYQQAKKESK